MRPYQQQTCLMGDVRRLGDAGRARHRYQPARPHLMFSVNRAAALRWSRRGRHKAGGRMASDHQDTVVGLRARVV